MAERQRYPASIADKQSGFPELNAVLRHILILYRQFFNVWSPNFITEQRENYTNNISH